MCPVRIATWNVNSLKARLPRVEEWLAYAQPDVLCLQETKLADDRLPGDGVQRARLRVAHHGEGRWNGVAILSRVGLDDVVDGFADGRASPTPRPGCSRRRAAASGSPACTCPTAGRVGTRALRVQARWLERAARRTSTPRATPTDAVVVCGDFNIAPDDRDVWDPPQVPSAAPTSASPSGDARRRPRGLGPGRRVPPRSTEDDRLFTLVGLPGRRLPQAPGHAHRPRARQRAAAPNGRRGALDRPQRPQGQEAVRPRAADRRPGGRVGDRCRRRPQRHARWATRRRVPPRRPMRRLADAMRLVIERLAPPTAPHRRHRARRRRPRGRRRRPGRAPAGAARTKGSRSRPTPGRPPRPLRPQPDHRQGQPASRRRSSSAPKRRQGRRARHVRLRLRGSARLGPRRLRRRRLRRGARHGPVPRRPAGHDGHAHGQVPRPTPLHRIALRGHARPRSRAARSSPPVGCYDGDVLRAEAEGSSSASTSRRSPR